jgi:hypothetical protein
VIELTLEEFVVDAELAYSDPGPDAFAGWMLTMREASAVMRAMQLSNVSAFVWNEAVMGFPVPVSAELTTVAEKLSCMRCSSCVRNSCHAEDEGSPVRILNTASSSE